MPDLIGLKLGRYAIIELLGAGGMATVYKAFDEILDRAVAIKIIRSEAFPPNLKDQLLKRFEREAKVLARLKHTHIVKVYDAGEHDGAPYLVLEYLPGGTFKDRLGKPIPYQEAARTLVPMARALDYAHTCGVLHRDLKPANILMNENDEPVLTDFGIARLLTLDEGPGLTMTGFGIGTPEYMAPEQGMGLDVDARADIYALGVVLYEAVTGRRPFTANTPMGVIFKHVHDPLPDPRLAVPDLPPLLVEMLNRSLAKQPAERFAAAADLADSLERLARLDQQPVDAPTIYRAAEDDEPGLDNYATQVGEAPQPLEDPKRVVQTAFAPLTPVPPAPKRAAGLPHGVSHISKRSLTLAAGVISVIALVLVLGSLALQSVNLLPTPASIAGVDGTPPQAAVPGATQQPSAAPQQTQVPAGGPDLASPAAPQPALHAGPTPTMLVNYAAQSTALPENLPRLSDLNMGSLQPLARWGRGVIESAAWDWISLWMAVPSSNGVYMYNTTDWQNGFLIETKTGASRAAFSPDGSGLLIGLQDGTIQFYHLQQGRLDEPIKAHASPVTDIVYAPDGRSFATSGGNVRLWNSAALDVVHTIAGSAMAFSPDGERLAVGTATGLVQVIAAADGSPIEMLEGHLNRVINLSFSESGDHLVSLSSQGELRFWYQNGDRRTVQLDPNLAGDIEHAAFSPSSFTLAVYAAQEETITLFFTTNGFPLSQVKGRVDWLVFSPEGQHLIGASRLDNAVRVWTEDGAQLINLKDFSGGSTENVLFVGDGSTLAVTGTDGVIYLLSAADGRVQRVLQGHTGRISSLSASADGLTLASAGFDDRTVMVWDLADGSTRHTLNSGREPYVSISEDGKVLAVAADSEIRVITLPDAETAGIYRITDCVSSSDQSCTSKVDLAPDGSLLAVFSMDNVYVWKLGETDVLRKMAGRSMVFSPVETILAVGSIDRDGWLWNPESGGFETELKGGPVIINDAPQYGLAPVNTLIYSQDGSFIAGGGSYGDLHIWRASDGELLAELAGYLPAAIGTNIAFSPDGKFLAVGSPDGAVRIWGVPPGN
jgi:serine/threonine protein kinase/WD40 repeat protein